MSSLGSSEFMTSQEKAEDGSVQMTKEQWETILGGIRHDGQLVCNLRREVEHLEAYKARLTWLHSGSEKDADGCEWGVYRVKWNAQGQVAEAWHTLSDFSDLDAAMAASGKAP